MIDDYFQKRPPQSSRPSKIWWIFTLRCLFYTSLVGFITGSAFGYLHIQGWISNAEKGLLLYGITFGIGALLSTCFVLYQLRQNHLKAQKIKVHQQKK